MSTLRRLLPFDRVTTIAIPHIGQFLSGGVWRDATMTAHSQRSKPGGLIYINCPQVAAGLWQRSPKAAVPLLDEAGALRWIKTTVAKPCSKSGAPGLRRRCSRPVAALARLAKRETDHAPDDY